MLLLLIGLGYSALSNVSNESGKLTCQNVMELTEEFIARELDRVTSRDVEEHLAGCERCTRHVNQTRQRTAPESESRIPGVPTGRVADRRAASGEITLAAL